MTTEWVWLRDEFEALNDGSRPQWLARAMYSISQCARASYGDMSDGNAHPLRLQRFNELLHRVASYNRAVLERRAERVPDQILIEMIVEELAALGVDHRAFGSMMRDHSKPFGQGMT